MACHIALANKLEKVSLAFETVNSSTCAGDITALMKSAALIASTSGVPVLDRFAGPASVMAAAIGVDPTKVNRVRARDTFLALSLQSGLS